MSVPDVATSISLRSLVPSVASAQPSSVLVRWMLRATTVIVFVVATVVGVQVALAAPAVSPVSISGSRR
jgi:cell division septal protein FtsQ